MYLSFGYTEMAGSDLWWHIAAGRELFQTGSPWMVDDWSYTAQGADWLNHEWLSDVVFYTWVSAGGVATLVYWKWLVIVVTFLLLQQTLQRHSGSSLAGFVCATIALAIAAPFLDVRPHLYSLLNFSLLLFLLLERQASRWLLALVFLIWVNLHGGFFFGLMALGVLLFPWRHFSLDALRSAFVTGLLCALVALLNPSGVDAYLYPLKYAFQESSPFRQLAEWHSPFRPGGIRSPLFFIFMYAPLLALAYCLPQVRSRVSIPWEGLVLTALTLAMALTSRRFIPLFGISLSLLLAPLLGLLLKSLQGRIAGVMLALAALLFAVFRMLPLPLQAAPAYHYLTAEYSYPVDILNFIEANELSGKVFAYYNWGGYLHWRTDGRLKVYIDGRADTLYDDYTFNNYVSVLRSEPGWIVRVEATGADYILWPHFRGSGREKIKELAESGRWRPLYQDSSGWLLQRADLPRLDPVHRSVETPWRNIGIGSISAWSGNITAAIEYGEKTRRVMPWNKDACNVLSSAYRQQGKMDEADSIVRDCQGYFPSPLLR